MCGLFFSSSLPEDRDRYLATVANFISHRGTMMPKFSTVGGMLFAHSLLPVQGEGPVEQPIVCGDNVLIFGGELWSHGDYSSDTEYLYDVLSQSSDLRSSVSQLDGMFALVFFSGPAGCVFFASDVFGEIPLYFAHRSGRLVIATEMKQLTALGVSLKEIRAALPGVLYAYRLDDEDLSQVEYHSWSFSNRERHLADGKISGLLRDSVRKRYETIDQQRSALLLSGGLDSAVLAYELAQLGLTDTYTVAAHADAVDLRAAEAVCDDLGLNFNPVMAQDLCPDCAIAITEVSNRSIVEEMCCHVVLSNALRDRGIRVVFAGCGADEIFVGYQHLLRYRTRQTRRTLQEEFVRKYHRMDLRAFNKAYMLNAIEVRSPYLSRALLDYAATLDVDSLLIGLRREMKVALRRAYSTALGQFTAQPKLIARDTMGARERLRGRYGDSPFVYRQRWKDLLEDSRAILELIGQGRALQ